MENFAQFGYLGLFIATFLAATILPLSSELVLTALLLSGLPPVSLVAIATLGNVLGSIINYALGYCSGTWFAGKFFGVSQDSFIRASNHFEKYGVFSLCFAWLPIVGDPLTFVAGVFRIHFLWFLLLVGVGKLFRYIVVSYIVLQVN